MGLFLGACFVLRPLAVGVLQRIADFMWWCHDCWVLPMEACFALGILANTVRRTWASPATYCRISREKAKEGLWRLLQASGSPSK